jgi:hypothetical protein
MDQRDGIQSPLESFSSFHGEDWSPQRAAFHQNLEQFADRIGLIVGLQGNGKVSQEEAYEQIKALWSQLKGSRKDLLD